MKAVRTMKIRTSKRHDVAFMIAVYAIITCFVAVCTYPFLNVLAYSLSSNNAILSGSVNLYPIGFRLEAYEKILHTNLILNALGISVQVTVLERCYRLSLQSWRHIPFQKNG